MITFTLLAFVAFAAFAASAEVDDQAPWTPGVTVRGVTCAGTVDEEEDLADLIQAGARAVTGNPRSVFKVASTTHLGFPSWLREVRSGSDLKVATDRVVQALLRTTCQDGYRAGYEAGLRAASGKKSEAKASTTRERVLKEELRTCSEQGSDLWEAVVGLATTLGGSALAAVAYALRAPLERLCRSALARLSRARPSETPEAPEAGASAPEAEADQNRPKPVATVGAQPRPEAKDQ